MSERPTPETDQFERSWYISADGWQALSDFARRLERERDEALVALRELMMDCDHLLLECPWHTREWADGVRKMQDRARALLARIDSDAGRKA